MKDIANRTGGRVMANENEQTDLSDGECSEIWVEFLRSRSTIAYVGL